jgi:hypothetical protein
MNSRKTGPKVDPARHWINGDWISSSSPVIGKLVTSQFSVLAKVTNGRSSSWKTPLSQALPAEAASPGSSVATPTGKKSRFEQSNIAARVSYSGVRVPMYAEWSPFGAWSR